ncbi:hypothetical protein [Streptomyces sp. TLI_171]|uniref:hypothetical protein n=1 Tax=Streptomyces sp. TLI_171 TaxID=1938859 RepID=UPI000C17E2AB|nr:hypothetical protein [Streptomyces sp. TLI_171]RKE23339.1 hypothetical protein BX266_6803 [Streptomyces sp. TLI_171]
MVLLAAPVASTIAADTARWDKFFADWVRPVGQVVIVAAIVLAVMTALSGLLTRTMVSCRAEAWKAPTIRCWTALGGAAMLAVGVLATVYPMFAPFHDAAWLALAFPLGVVLPGLALPVFASGLHWSRAGRLEYDRRRLVMPRGTAVTLALLWAGLLTYFLVAGHQGRLIVADAGLAVLGITAVATALGQSLRIQIEAQDATGAADAAASDYVLSRLQHLSTKSIDRVGISRASELSKLLSEDLSAIPAGNIAGSIAKVLYAIRPGLTWRARVTTIDSDRVTVTLTRNGLHAFTALVSRPELGLPAIPPDTTEPALTGCRDQARAQLLTSAAACILVSLSKGHRELSQGLCGAEQWTAVALHVIATDSAMAGDPPLQRALLRQAVHLQPGYGPARFDYLGAQFMATGRTLDDRLRFARLLAPLVELAKDEDDGTIRFGWETVYLEALYGRIVLWLGGYLGEHGRPDRRKIALLMEAEPTLVADVEACADELSAACATLHARCEQESRRFDTGELLRYIEAMSKRAELIGAMLGLIKDQKHQRGHRPSRWTSPEPDTAPSPELAYSYARLAALVRTCKLDPGPLGEPEDHLALAIAGTKDRRTLKEDPSFVAMLHDRSAGTMRVIGFEDRVGMLELPPFLPFADRLREIGLTSFAALLASTGGGADRQELASYLGVSGLRANQLLGIARLSDLHEDLSRPEVVKVFLDVGVTCPADLRRRVREDSRRLDEALQSTAYDQGVRKERAFAEPERWHRALDGPRIPPARVGSVDIGRNPDPAAAC